MRLSEDDKLDKALYLWFVYKMAQDISVSEQQYKQGVRDLDFDEPVWNTL